MFGDNTLSLNQKKNLLDADVYQYNTLSDGVKKIYTNDDELMQYGDRGILDPNDVSFFSLFINGVLQPKVNYEIQKGLLFLKTEEAPIKDAAIIISFITFKDRNTTSAKLSYALVEGTLPSGVTSSGPATDMNICVQENISNHLCLESALLCGPQCIPSGCKGIWEFALTISNKSHMSITDIVIKDTILLDLITNIKNISVSCGSIVIKDKAIIWNIDVLKQWEYATANFRTEGFFQAGGARCIGRSMACGNTVAGTVTADIICIHPIDVGQGLELTQTITSGPTKVKVNTANTWRIEIKISNLSTDIISGILIRDILCIDHIKCIKIISISHGATNILGNELLWKIDILRECDTSVLIVDITGCFCQKGLKALGIAAGVGRVNTKKIFSNISQDFQIEVSPKMDIAKKKLLLRAIIFNKSMRTFLGRPEKWNFSLNITNTADGILSDLIVIDYILLDEFKNITIKSITSGNIAISDNSIIWKIERLLPYQTLTVSIELEGTFYATGCRSISRAIAGGSDINTYVLSNITSGCPVKVLSRCDYAGPFIRSNTLINPKYDIKLTNLTIKKHIVSGPLEVTPKTINIWKVEIKISNNGYGPVNNIVMTDNLLLDNLICFNPISFTQGTVCQENNVITWDIGTLNSRNTVVLLAEITGCFHNDETLDVSDYQYNTVSNGIKKEFTNDDALLIYGDDGIPDPNDVSFFNLYINGILQPETNYSVETGLLTLTIAEPPKKDVPIILEYLIIKGRANQLIKAETYQYNTVSNGGKTYTNADELTIYGDRGILDPKQTSYSNLFVNGVIQPSINYTIEPGSLTLTVEDAPMKESPILIKFVSLYR